MPPAVHRRLCALGVAAVVLGVLLQTAALAPSDLVGAIACASGLILLILPRNQISLQAGPADWVTLSRVVLVGGIAGVVADSQLVPGPGTN
jgi:hypothetical protein